MGKEEHVSDLDRKIFTYWVNKVLVENGLEAVSDLGVEFAVGNFFLKFIELVSSKQVPKDTNKLKVLTCVASLNKTARKDTVQSISPNHDSIALGVYFLVFVEHLPLKRPQVNEIADAQLPAIIDTLWALFQFYVVPSIAAKTGCRKGSAKEVMASILKHSQHRIRNIPKATIDGTALVAIMEQYRADLLEEAAVKQAATGEVKVAALLAAVAEAFGLSPLIQEGDLSVVDTKADQRALLMILSLTADTVIPARSPSFTAGSSPAGSRIGAAQPCPVEEAELVGLRLKVAGLERQLARVEAAAAKLQMMVSLMLSDQDSVGAARAAEMRAVERIAVLEQSSDFLVGQLEEANLNIRQLEGKLEATQEILYPELAEERMAFPDAMNDADKIEHLQQLVVMYKGELRSVAEKNHTYSEANEELSSSNRRLTNELHTVRQKKVELQKLLASAKLKVSPEPSPARRSAPTRTGMATPLRARTGTDGGAQSNKLLIGKERSATIGTSGRQLKRSLSAVMTDHVISKDKNRATPLKKSITSLGPSSSTEGIPEIRSEDVDSTPKKRRSRRKSGSSSKEERSSSRKRERTKSDLSSETSKDECSTEKEKRRRRSRRDRKECSSNTDSDCDSAPSTPRRTPPTREWLRSPRRPTSPTTDPEDIMDEIDEILDIVDQA